MMDPGSAASFVLKHLFHEEGAAGLERQMMETVMTGAAAAVTAGRGDIGEWVTADGCWRRIIWFDERPRAGAEAGAEAEGEAGAEEGAEAGAEAEAAAEAAGEAEVLPRDAPMLEATTLHKGGLAAALAPRGGLTEGVDTAERGWSAARESAAESYDSGSYDPVLAPVVWPSLMIPPVPSTPVVWPSPMIPPVPSTPGGTLLAGVHL